MIWQIDLNFGINVFLLFILELTSFLFKLFFKLIIFELSNILLDELIVLFPLELTLFTMLVILRLLLIFFLFEVLFDE